MAEHVWLVRHGATEWSGAGKHTGNTDLALTAKGEAAARALAPVLGRQNFALVLASRLQRAYRTAELAGLHPEIDDDLREWDYGDDEGRTTAEIREERPGWTVWSDGAKGGETADEVGVRADRVIARLRDVDGDVALVAHGHFLRVFGARWVGQPGAFGASLKLSTAAVCVLGYERETPAIERWNDTHHLD